MIIIMNKKESSFTLIELLVVIAIIGVLSGLIIIGMSGATDAAKDAKRKSDIEQLEKAVLMYGTLSGSYPIQSTQCDIGSNCANISSTLIPTYFSVFPLDPNGGYYTYQSTDGTNFIISSILSSGNSYRYFSSTGFSTSVAKVFTAVGTSQWTVPSGCNYVEVLVVAGGGSGGNIASGGGGAGGLIYNPSFPVTPGQSLTVTVGNGGASALLNGGNSVFSTITATGGGAGAAWGAPSNKDGGSGGGAGFVGGSPSALGLGTPGQGHNGASCTGGYNNVGKGGGGGGAGADASGTSGGAGMSSSITGTAVIYAGGGGAGFGTNFTGPGGSGGTGGGGTGGSSNTNGTNGANGLGGGGGGNYGLGGSGVVIVRCE